MTRQLPRFAAVLFVTLVAGQCGASAFFSETQTITFEGIAPAGQATPPGESSPGGAFNPFTTGGVRFTNDFEFDGPATAPKQLFVLSEGVFDNPFQSDYLGAQNFGAVRIDTPDAVSFDLVGFESALFTTLGRPPFIAAYTIEGRTRSGATVLDDFGNGADQLTTVSLGPEWTDLEWVQIAVTRQSVGVGRFLGIDNVTVRINTIPEPSGVVVLGTTTAVWGFRRRRES